ncbi:uncharacterized protein LOC117285368 [Fukomys damarensis]|uniref:uncharacterized protein LOC117285368 n=1 Tax=Fukomys damarensis TaxID=885580 RepID=UPI00053FD1F0|nr:uncharacterized protein LOC117285368 [Fukomys damarensis]
MLGPELTRHEASFCLSSPRSSDTLTLNQEGAKNYSHAPLMGELFEVHSCTVKKWSASRRGSVPHSGHGSEKDVEDLVPDGEEHGEEPRRQKGPSLAGERGREVLSGVVRGGLSEEVTQRPKEARSGHRTSGRKSVSAKGKSKHQAPGWGSPGAAEAWRRSWCGRSGGWERGREKGRARCVQVVITLLCLLSSHVLQTQSTLKVHLFCSVLFF